MKLNANARLLLVTILAAMVFVPSAQRLKLAPRQSVNVEMQVALPLFVQVAMAAGDRFLAANIAAIRALWVDNFKMQKEEFKVLAKGAGKCVLAESRTRGQLLHCSSDIALEWRSRGRTTDSRSGDHGSPFRLPAGVLLRLQLVAFQGDAVGASNWMREAAEYLPEEIIACRCRIWQRSGSIGRVTSTLRSVWSRPWPGRPIAVIFAVIFNSA